jgi:very-short-patch-repair endonuclease
VKFRRQHSIGQYIVDFACVERRLVVEVDGGYHEAVFDNDQDRQRYLERNTWTVIRFDNEDVMQDVEAVAVAIARQLDLKREFLD